MNNLYRIELKGMHYNAPGCKVEGTTYVVAENTDEAYKKVRQRLDKKDYGYSGDRELVSITLLADDRECCGADYPLVL